MSLRSRLAVGMVLVASVLVVAAAVVIQLNRSYLTDQVDAQLRASMAPARFLATEGDRLGPTGPGPAPDPGDPLRFSRLWVGAVGASGTVVALANPLGDPTAPQPDLTAADAQNAAAERPPQPFSVDSVGSSTDYRMLAEPLPSGDIVVAGLPLDDVAAASQRLLLVLGGATLLVLTTLGLVSFWVMRLGVRPIKQMTQTATAIAAGDLSHRVTEPPEGTEAGELGAALNVMLGRIEAAFAEREAADHRLRQFVADASHELRTPVTSIRGYAELGRTGQLVGAELDDAFRRMEAESVRLGGLVDDLLLLARLDQGRPLDQAPVDLSRLAHDAALDAGARAPGRAVTVDDGGPTVVTGDEARLRQVVTNLVGNALEHTDGAVRVAVQVSGRQAVLAVVDDGPGMAPDVAAQAFDRFYRADPARTRSNGGSGLGLAIVRSIVDAHGGAVTLQSGPTGTEVTVTLPLAPTPLPPPVAASTAT
jgi:two-component system OmpR family sensor kinase